MKARIPSAGSVCLCRVYLIIMLFLALSACHFLSPADPDPVGLATRVPAESMRVPTEGTRVSAEGARCGDGICNGPESMDRCPQDCDAASSNEESAASDPESTTIPPLLFFYAIHTHASGEHLPYGDPGMTTLDPLKAENMLAAIEGITVVLDSYGVKGTWEFLPAGAQGLCEFGGQNHALAQLEAHGHEIGVHAHQLAQTQQAFAALQLQCGITPHTTSGLVVQVQNLGMGDAQDAASRALQEAADLDLRVSTVNLSPGGGKNPFDEICGDQFGIGNDMWGETGNLMFPWRPDISGGDICVHDEGGPVVLLDHVSIEWLILEEGGAPPDVLTDLVAAWGFVTHITEYAEGNQAEAPPDPASLAALDRFLAYVDSKRVEGRVVYVTASEIGDLIFDSP